MEGCYIPVSFGELYDKHSILEIKYARVTDSHKLKQIKKEMDYLKEYVDKYDLNVSIKQEMKEINEKLWDIENSIREKENKQEFDDEFISLARSVYIKNDERNEIKNKINLVLNSNIIDIKNYSKY
jgi:hypothetical protein